LPRQSDDTELVDCFVTWSYLVVGSKSENRKARVLKEIIEPEPERKLGRGGRVVNARATC